MVKKSLTAVMQPDVIEKRILLIRGHKVMLSTDLAELYEVEPRALVQAVKRNAARFPKDFMFQLSWTEFRDLRSQIVISSWGGLRRAIQVNIAIMRAFVKLRKLLSTHEDLARKLAELELKYDAQFRVVFDAIRELMGPGEVPERRRIGF